jgi:PAS domain S-box-containing protein
MRASRSPSDARYEAVLARQVATRAPLGLLVFVGCVALSAAFEIARFPARRGWMLGFALAFWVSSAIVWGALRRRPAASIPIVLAFVNVVGVALNVYHAAVGAPVAMCVWTLTGLLGASAVLVPWGPRRQVLASLGTLASYPIHLHAGTADPLTWAAGGTYLLVVAGLSVFASSLLARYLRGDLALTAALSEREARLRSYFDLALVGTAILSPEGVSVEVNDELCRMLGRDRATLVGRPWTDVVHPEERTAAAAMLVRAAGPNGTPERRELRCLRADGAALDAIVSVRGLPGPTGAVDHAMVVVQDITDRKRAEAERERAKDQFLAAVSHELRTPLTPILAWSELLRDGRLGAEQAQVALAAVQRNARAQALLIDDLLDVSRAVTGEWRLALRPLDIVPVTRAAVDVVRSTAEAKGVALVTTLPAGAVRIAGDPQRLQQIVWNLVSNAVKFTPRGGRVDVELAPVGARARIVVRDTGEGIGAAFVPHVFEWFRQGRIGAPGRQGGLGLGLGIVRALVERHGGTVRCESPGEGAGATFTVELPLLAADLVAGEHEPPEVDHPVDVRLRGLRVLVVDDDADSNAVVRALLASCGAEVRTAVSAADALDVVRTWQPDVLVSDIAMPGDDGCALLRKLRARGGPLGRVPAVALTAFTGAADRLRVLEAGFQAHVAKPFAVSELAAVVEDAVHGRGGTGAP